MEVLITGAMAVVVGLATGQFVSIGFKNKKGDNSELFQKIDAIERAVEQAVSQFDFTDTDNYEIDYSLDYDGRVQCESHEFINDSDLVDMIVTKVCNLFKEADCPEDEPTAEQINKTV